MSNTPNETRLEAAERCGFVATDPGPGAFDGTYSCTVTQLVAFAKECESAGRAQIAAALRVVIEKQPAGDVRAALTVAADMCDAINAAREKESGQ